jgi:hypothetical protein
MNPMEIAVQSLERAVKSYVQDLEILSDSQVMNSAGGSARSPVDFTYEVALINLRIAARLSGQEPPAAPEGDDWWIAPDDIRSKAGITKYFQDSGAALASAAKAMPEADIAKLTGAPGSERPAYALVNFAALHTMYHDAQLNFIQSLAGDLKTHWD